MWNARYWAARQWAARYWAKVGAASIVLPLSIVTRSAPADKVSRKGGIG